MKRLLTALLLIVSAASYGQFIDTSRYINNASNLQYNNQRVLRNLQVPVFGKWSSDTATKGPGYLKVIGNDFYFTGADGYYRSILNSDTILALRAVKQDTINTPQILNVEINGSDITGRRGRRDRPFRTADAAYDAALPGDFVKVGIGAFLSPTPSKIKASVNFSGSGQMYHNGRTGVPPTRLIGSGTRFVSTFLVPYTVDHIAFSSFGVDVGKDVCDSLYGGVGQDAFLCGAISTNTHNDATLRKGMFFSCISTLGNNPNNAKHGFLLEGCEGEHVSNINSAYCYATLVCKTVNGQWSDVTGTGGGTYGFIAKSDVYAHCEGLNINGLTLGSFMFNRGATPATSSADGRGLTLYTDDATGYPMKNINIANAVITRVSLGGLMSSGTVNKMRNINISNVVIDSSTHNGVGMNLESSILSNIIVKNAGDIGMTVRGTKGIQINNCAVYGSKTFGVILGSADSTLTFSSLTTAYNGGLGASFNPGEVKGCGFSTHHNGAGTDAIVYVSNCLPNVQPSYVDTYTGSNGDSTVKNNVFVGTYQGSHYPNGSDYWTAINLSMGGNKDYNTQIGATYDDGIWTKYSLAGVYRPDHRILTNPDSNSTSLGKDSGVVYASGSKHLKKIHPFNEYGRVQISNINYTATVNDEYIGVISLTVVPTITLPTTSDFTKKHIIIKDETGLASAAKQITVTPVDSDGIIDIAKDYREYFFNGTTWQLLRKGSPGIPKMTTTQRDAITSPAEGLEIYNTTTHTKNFYNGTVWKAVLTD